MAEVDDAALGDLNVRDDVRARAHAALDRWLDACKCEAIEAFASGRSGYFGRFKLAALVDDNGVRLRVEAAFMQEDDL